jgi:N-acetylglucosaminyldiphosphoundecaprenol N-acetyl-beta-D-mannosaminyltransferase
MTDPMPAAPTSTPTGALTEVVTADVCGVAVSAGSSEAMAQWTLASRFGTGRVTHLCSAYTLSLTVRSERYRRMLQQADINIADGQVVPRVVRRTRHDVSGMQGYDLMLETFVAGQDTGLRHYLYGGSEATLVAMQRRLYELAPRALIVAADSPDHHRLDAAERAAFVGRITAARPDIVWVALGTPAQDYFCLDLGADVPATFIPVGAAFDYIAGAKRMAPKWMRQLCLEWMFRLLREPRRLWKRYLIGNPVFIYGVIAGEWRQRRARRSRPAMGA